jgi:hypothetical protein
MAEVDVDGIVSDVLLADLEQLDAGKREGLSLAVNVPRQGSRPFETYLQRCASPPASCATPRTRS